MTTPYVTPTGEVDAERILGRLQALGDLRAELAAQDAAAEAEQQQLVRAYVRREAKRDPLRPVNQTDAADAARVDRMTVRDWLGIRRRTQADRLAAAGTS
jgi:hypothetical protein